MTLSRTAQAAAKLLEAHERRLRFEALPKELAPATPHEAYLIQDEFVAMLRDVAATAVEQHELPVSEDPDRLAFELHAALLAADARFVLHDDPAVLDLARRVVSQRLGLDDGPNRHRN